MVAPTVAVIARVALLADLLEVGAGDLDLAAAVHVNGRVVLDFLPRRRSAERQLAGVRPAFLLAHVRAADRLDGDVVPVLLDEVLDQRFAPAGRVEARASGQPEGKGEDWGAEDRRAPTVGSFLRHVHLPDQGCLWTRGRLTRRADPRSGAGALSSRGSRVPARGCSARRRATASARRSSGVVKEIRKKPSPLGPYAPPGEMTTAARSSTCSQ